MDWGVIANAALTATVLAVPLGVAAVCSAISLGEHPVSLRLGEATVFFTGLAVGFGLLLTLHAIWV